MRTDAQKAKSITGLAVTLGEDLSKERLAGYLALLADLSAAQVEQACAICGKTGKFFPKPAELRDAVLGSVEDAALTAWGQVMSELRRVGWTGRPDLDSSTWEAVKELGGWRALCEASFRELDWKQKDFVAAYRLSACRERAQESLPAGTSSHLLAIGGGGWNDC